MKTTARDAALALLIAVAFASAMMLFVGRSPGHIWLLMLERTLGDRNSIGDVLYRATGLTLAGLSVAIALDAGLFNIGAEGQMTAGVLACSIVGIALPDATPAVLAIPACMLAAMAAGAAVGALIGVLRVARNAHEVITSIMLNAIITGVALYCGNLFLFANGTTRGDAIAAGARLPHLPLHNSSANVAIVVAAVAVALVWWLRARTTWGIAWRAVGQAPAAARSAGISVGRVQILVLTGAGALAGLIATNLVMGQSNAFEEGLGRGTGLLGISAAVLGRRHPAGIAGAALLLAFLSVGGQSAGELVPKEVAEMLQGVVVLAVAATTGLTRWREARA